MSYLLVLSDEEKNRVITPCCTLEDAMLMALSDSYGRAFRVLDLQAKSWVPGAQLLMARLAVVDGQI